MTAALVLIGLRVSGKTTLGQRVARDLGRPFVDLDDRVAVYFDVGHAGEALKTHGEPRFRAAEAACLKTALAEDGIVLSLGGGTPTAPGAAELLRDTAARVIYLHARPETLADRLRAIGSATRPSLTGVDPADEIAAIYARRHPLYESIADVVIDADYWDEDALAAEVIAAMG